MLQRCLLQGTKDFLKGMGLGLIADQLADLNLGELLDTPPPGLDEAVAIAKVSSLLSPASALQIQLCVETQRSHGAGG